MPEPRQEIKVADAAMAAIEMVDLFRKMNYVDRRNKFAMQRRRRRVREAEDASALADWMSRTRTSPDSDLYGLNSVEIDLEYSAGELLGNFVAPRSAKEFSATLVSGTWGHRKELDGLIAESSDNWSLGRMSKVDISILRMAVFEFLYCDDIPPKVSINEAVDLGKTFGSENSGSFINGILDALNLKISKGYAAKPVHTASGPAKS